MPALTADRTCIVIADKIPATQREIIKMQITQIFMLIDNVELIDFYESDKLSKYIDSDDIEVVKVMDSYSCKDWTSTFNHFQTVLHHYRNVIIINSPTFRFMKEDAVTMIKKYEDACLNDPNYLFDKSNGNAIRSHIVRLLFVKAASASFERRNVYQFVLGPKEVDYRKVWNFRVYERIGPWEWEDTKLGPTYEYALSHIYIQDIDKVQDFYWSACHENKPMVEEFSYLCTVFLNKRLWSAPWLNAIKGYGQSYSKTETRKVAIPQEEYYYNLMLSKYTLISETDDGSFPIVRFMEAIILGCIPILHYNINFDILKLTDKRFYDIIKSSNLKINEFHPGPGSQHKHNTIVTMCDRFKMYYGDDVDVIKYLRTSNYYRALTNEEVVKEYYKQLLGGIRRTK